MNLQALIDGMSAQWQRERAQSQMTLGGLIERLEEIDSKVVCAGLCYPHSYRGYYSDLAFQESDKPVDVVELLETCRACMGQVFTGYKGGDYVMGALTPVWVANYGDCGLKLIALNDDGTIETATDDD
jgi:hypothetical protein